VTATQLPNELDAVRTEEPRPGDRRPIIALFASNAVSQIGNMMTAVAVPWFVLETTGSAAQTGLAGAAVAGGAVVSAILGGPLVDRFGFRRASVTGDLLAGAAILIIPLLHIAGLLEIWHLLLLVFAMSSLNAQGDTAKFALVPLLSVRGGMALERANATDRGIARLGQVIGPVLAGFLIAVIGAANVLFFQAATFVVSATLIALFVPATAALAARAPATERRSYLSELLEGLTFVRRNRLILSMILVATVGNFLDVPLVSVVIPVYAKTVFESPSALGAILAALGGGALVGTVLFGVLGPRLPRRVTFLTAWILAPLLVYGALVISPPLAVLVVAAAIAGVLAGPINPLLVTVIQENVPRELAGRVFGSLNALAQAGIPFGAAVVGLVIEGAGLIETIAGMGLIYLAMTVSMLFNPALRQMDRRTNVPSGKA